MRQKIKDSEVLLNDYNIIEQTGAYSGFGGGGELPSRRFLTNMAPFGTSNFLRVFRYFRAHKCQNWKKVPQIMFYKL